jgi:hypothetical protein
MATTGEGSVRKGIETEYATMDFKKFFQESSVPQSQFEAEFAKWQALQKLVMKRPG